MGHLLYLMFRCDFDVMESLEEFEDLNTPIERNRQASVTFLCVSQDIFSSNGKSNGHGEIIEKSTVYPWIKKHNVLDEIWNIILLLLIVENYPPLPLK